jgi:hypothetical protein
VQNLSADCHSAAPATRLPTSPGDVAKNHPLVDNRATANRPSANVFSTRIVRLQMTACHRLPNNRAAEVTIGAGHITATTEKEFQ